MAELNKKLLNNLTQLCRIGMPEAEQDAFLADLQKILNYVELLDEVDTDGVAPCNHVLADMYNVEREDEVGETLPRKVFLDNAPEHTGGMIRVPPVIRKS